MLMTMMNSDRAAWPRGIHQQLFLLCLLLLFDPRIAFLPSSFLPLNPAFHPPHRTPHSSAPHRRLLTARSLAFRQRFFSIFGQFPLLGLFTFGSLSLSSSRSIFGQPCIATAHRISQSINQSIVPASYAPFFLSSLSFLFNRASFLLFVCSLACLSASYKALKAKSKGRIQGKRARSSIPCSALPALSPNPIPNSNSRLVVPLFLLLFFPFFFSFGLGFLSLFGLSAPSVCLCPSSVLTLSIFAIVAF